MIWPTRLISYPLLLVSLIAAPLAFGQATPKSLIVSVYTSQKGADKAYDALKDVEKSKAIEVDGFAVVSKNDKGKVDVYNTRQKDARWGGVIGGVVGLLTMGPIGAVGGASLGGGTGWLVGHATGISKDSIKNIEQALEPNTSALVAVVDNKWVGDLEKAMKAEATKTLIKEELQADRIEQAQTESAQEKSKPAH